MSIATPRPPALSKLSVLLALLTFASLAGCRDDDDARRTALLHLEPRLADGRSSAEVLAAFRSVVAAWHWEADEDLQGPWHLHGAELGPRKAPGLHLLGFERAAGAGERAALSHAEPLDAASVDLIELDLSRVTAGTTRVHWKTHGSATFDGMVEAGHEHAQEDPVTVRIPLANHPSWRGKIAVLRIIPSATTVQNFQVHGVRFIREGFAYGDSPLNERPGGPGGAGGDGGLVTVGVEARRAYPTSWDVPLFVRNLALPAAARFECELATRAAESGTPARFALDLRQAGGAWNTVATAELAPTGWSAFSADLDAHSGQTVDLRLRATRASRADRPERAGDAAAEEREPQAADVYWGVPRVLGVDARRRPGPNVVLITVDTLRYDALGAYDGVGAGRRLVRYGETPFLDGLAQDGILFEDAWSTSNATSPSHASLLTGLAVQDHGVVDNRSALGPETETLAEIFRRAGYETAAAVSVAHLRSERSGLGQGFDYFRQADTAAPRDGAVTLGAIQKWLENWSARGEAPLFLWVHLFDPHTPYGPPADFYRDYLARYELEEPPTQAGPDDATIGETKYTEEGDFLAGVTNPTYASFLYSAGASYADRLVADLHADMARRGLLDSAILCITSDHGESLGEHDIWYDHAGLYSESLRVPLILQLPGGPSGRRVRETVSGIDVPRTLLAAADLAAPAEMRGQSLLETLAADPAAPTRRIWFEHSSRLSIGNRDPGLHFIAVMNRDPLTRVIGDTPKEVQLFDHRSDPDLLRDISSERSELTGEALSQLLEWRAQSLERSGQALTLTASDIAELEALGYVGGDEDE